MTHLLLVASKLPTKTSVARQLPTNKHTHTDRPAQFKVADISCSMVTLTWEKLSGALPNQLYRVFCNGTAQYDHIAETSCDISGLPHNQTHNCTVVGISETGTFNSLRSFEFHFIPGKIIPFYIQRQM